MLAKSLKMSADMVALQIRHGAALALREVLRHQADAAGVLAPVAAHPTGWHHLQHCQSLALLLCIRRPWLHHAHVS